MIELKENKLVVSFPEVHPNARMSLQFQRTLRIPDDDRTYWLPPGVGNFPLRHVDDFATRVPPAWLEHGGVMMPMYQAEAMWVHFMENWDFWKSLTPEGPRDRPGMPYPFAIKVAAGKINAVSGEPWQEGIHRDPQDYMVVPGQPWLDGFCVEKGVIRQFVAMPLGSGYSAEEQLTGKAESGGLQISVFPMKREAYVKLARDYVPSLPSSFLLDSMSLATSAMGLAPGGRMKQDIYQDRFSLDDWDLRSGSRCFIHIANSEVWREITGQLPPIQPPTAADYTKAGLPWFDYYDESRKVLSGSGVLAKLRSVASLSARKREQALPENESVSNEVVVKLHRGLPGDVVREGRF